MSVHSPLGATQSGAFELGARGLDAPSARSRSWSGLFGLGGLLITGVLITVSAASTDSLLPESVRPVPTWLAGPFANTGIDLHVGGVLIVLTIMFACYAVAVHAADRLSARSVLLCIAGLNALMLLAPALFSTDVFSYQAYARMGDLYGANPYVIGPHAIALDPVYPFIGADWVTIPSAYGPLFTMLSYPLAPLSIVASVFTYKAFAVIASVAIVALVWNAAGLRGINPVKAVALVGLNPLLVVYGVGGGHNDILMLAALVAGVVLVLQQRERLGAASMVAATGIKLTAALLLPFALAGSSNPRDGSRRREVVIGAAVAAAALGILSFVMFGAGVLHLPATVQRSQSAGDWHSIPGFVASRHGLGTVGHILGVVLAIAFIATACWLLRRVWRGELDWIAGAGWATAAMLVTASSIEPWYPAWLLPLAALGRDRRLFWVAIVLGGLVQLIQLLGYIPHGTSLF